MIDLDDPASHYRRLLERPPFQDRETGLWVVSRYADVRRVLPDTTDFSNRLTLFPHYPLSDAAMALLGSLQGVPATTAGGDGEVHDRAHQAIRATFPTSLARALESMSGIVQARVDELVARLPRRGPVDLIRDFAWELPLRVICDVLGFAPDRYEDIKTWSMGQIALVWGKPEPAEQLRYAQGLVNLWKQCQELVAERRRTQAAGGELPDDMTGRLLRDGRLDDDEVASVLLNFAVAGHETTANGIGNAVHDLLSRPGAWRELADQREPSYLARLVVEEELRLNPPIIGWSRVSTRPVEIGGVSIPENQRVLLLLGAANRDPHHYADPDEFEPGRQGDHLSFGLGAHFCVGAPLARLEMTTALTTLVRSFPDARLADGFGGQHGKYHPNLGFRALKALPVVLQP